MERLILQSDQVDSRDNQNPSNFVTPDHRNDGSQMLLLDDRYLTLRLSTSRVVVSDQAGREWMVDLMAVVYVFFASGLVCYLIALPLQPLTGMVGLPVVIIHAFLFPPVLLAALDADSIFVPY